MKIQIGLVDGDGHIVGRGPDIHIHTETMVEKKNAKGEPVLVAGEPVLERVVSKAESDQVYDGLRLVLIDHDDNILGDIWRVPEKVPAATQTADDAADQSDAADSEALARRRRRGQ